MYDLVFIKIILVVPNPIPCWANEMKRRFLLGKIRINWIFPATKWFSMLLMRFPLLGQVFWILSWNYYFHYQYYYSIGGNHLLWAGISCRQVWRLNKSLALTYKKKSSNFWYTFISHTKSWTQASWVKARCTCHYTILNWLKCADQMLVYMKQMPHPYKK